MNERNFENDEIERDVGDVEHLLMNMSLKSPSTTLDHSITNMINDSKDGSAGRTNALHSWSGLLAFASAALLAGFLLGRFTLGGNESEHPTAERVATDHSSMVTAAPTQSKNIEAGNNEARNIEAGNIEELVRISLVDKGLFFVDGRIPVRTYVAHSRKEIEVVEDSSGKRKRVSIPVRKTIVAPAPGI